VCHDCKNFATSHHIAAESPQRLSLIVCFVQVCGVAWIRLQTACFRQLCDPTGLTAFSSRCGGEQWCCFLHAVCSLWPGHQHHALPSRDQEEEVFQLWGWGLHCAAPLYSRQCQVTLCPYSLCAQSPTACLKHTRQLNELDLAVANTGRCSQACRPVANA